MSIKPFIGQRVDFYSPHLPYRPLVATVAEVLTGIDGHGKFVNLAVIMPSGDSTSRQGVPYLSENENASLDLAYAVELDGHTAAAPVVAVPVLTESISETDFAHTEPGATPAAV